MVLLDTVVRPKFVSYGELLEERTFSLGSYSNELTFVCCPGVFPHVIEYQCRHGARLRTFSKLNIYSKVGYFNHTRHGRGVSRNICVNFDRIL